MKLSFWTLGMPPWPNIEIARRARYLGYHGVDLRCTMPVDGKPSDNGNVCTETNNEELDDIRKMFADAGVELSCLLCYNRAGHEGNEVDWDVVEAELVAHARIAQRLGCPQMRVQVWRPDKSWTWDWDDYLENLGRVSLTAVKETSNVMAVYENHVGSASAAQLLRMVEKRGDPRLGVVFSPDHCVVMQEDSVKLAKDHLGAIKQVCLSDRRVVEEDLGKFDGRYYYVRYETCLMGEGIVPTARILDVLSAGGYDGFIALKWEKSDRFGHQLPSGEVALSHFIEYMAGLGIAAKGG